jgi:hypothetical protein
MNELLLYREPTVDAPVARPRCAPLKAGFSVPTHDLGSVLERVGTKLYVRERTLVQYVAWSVQTGLLEVLDRLGPATVAEAASGTPLTEGGADALLGVLSALGLITRSPDARYALTGAAREFFLTDSPYFVGDQLDPVGPPIPRPYLRQRTSFITRLKLRLLSLQYPALRYGTRARIDNQHARNLGACAAAIRTGEFANVRCLVDIAGGSGVFAIPFALDYPGKRIVLTELPGALANVKPLLREHGLEARIELMPMDAFSFPWKIPECDGMFIGNFLHGFSDDVCRRICREGFDRLQPGGQLWVHELLWNETRDGPLITALWHAAMRSSSPGGQRTARELSALLQDVGFIDVRTVPTSGAFAMVCGRKPGNAGARVP